MGSVCVGESSEEVSGGECVCGSSEEWGGRRREIVPTHLLQVMMSSHLCRYTVCSWTHSVSLSRSTGSTWTTGCSYYCYDYYRGQALTCSPQCSSNCRWSSRISGGISEHACGYVQVKYMHVMLHVFRLVNVHILHIVGHVGCI